MSSKWDFTIIVPMKTLNMALEVRFGIYFLHFLVKTHCIMALLGTSTGPLGNVLQKFAQPLCRNMRNCAEKNVLQKYVPL